MFEVILRQHDQRRLADGTIENFRVMLYENGRCRNTGRGFELQRDAKLFADGMVMAVSTLHGPGSVVMRGDFAGAVITSDETGKEIGYERK